MTARKMSALKKRLEFLERKQSEPRHEHGGAGISPSEASLLVAYHLLMAEDLFVACADDDDDTAYAGLERAFSQLNQYGRDPRLFQAWLDALKAQWSGI